MSGSTPMAHALSFDIECYYQIVAKDYLGRALDPTPEVERNTDYLIELLAAHDTKATFFVLGNVARKYQSLIERIVGQGHELAVHGDEHLYITQMTKHEFREELKRAVASLEEVSGVKITGHRAPAFSVTKDTLWALDILQEQGLEYDSSIYPIKASRYGIPDAPKTPYRLPGGLVEVPLTAVTLRGRDRPAAGGGYFRIFPYAYTRWAMGVCERERRAAVTYFHPHEFELSKPTIAKAGGATTAGRRSRPRKKSRRSRPTKNASGAVTTSQKRRLAKFNFLQGIGRGRSMRAKLERLLNDYSFVTIGEIARTVGQNSEIGNTINDQQQL